MTLIDIYTIGFSCIDEKFVKIVCKNFEIEPQPLTKLELLYEFDGKAAKPIIHAIYLTLLVKKHN